MNNKTKGCGGTHVRVMSARCSREVLGGTCSPGQGPTHRHPRASTIETRESLVQGTGRVVVQVPLQKVLMVWTDRQPPSVSGVSSSDSHSSVTAPSWAAVVETRGAGVESVGCSSATPVESWGMWSHGPYPSYRMRLCRWKLRNPNNTGMPFVLFRRTSSQRTLSSKKNLEETIMQTPVP